MPLSPYIADMRERIGHSLLLLPTVAVLPRDVSGRVLLVRQTDTDKWATIGGSVEPDESPDSAACREALEEAGVTVELTGLLAALGGPDYRITYPNGDLVACVAIVYGATVVSGEPTPDGDETSEVGWFGADQLGDLDVNDINRRLLAETLPLLEG